MECEHPIESLMRTTLDSIKNMVDVNTILGDPVETPDGKVIVPISRVTFAFAAGGTEYEPSCGQEDGTGGRPRGGSGPQDSGQKGGGLSAEEARALPFGGGSGAGISIQPVGFLVVGREDMRLLPVDGQVLYDRLIDLAPRILDGLQGLARGRAADHQVAAATPAGGAGTQAAPGSVPGPVGAAAPPASPAGKPLIRLRGRGPTRLS
jgi:sporulation protein YtfJ